MPFFGNKWKALYLFVIVFLLGIQPDSSEKKIEEKWCSVFLGYLVN